MFDQDTKTLYITLNLQSGTMLWKPSIAHFTFECTSVQPNNLYLPSNIYTTSKLALKPYDQITFKTKVSSSENRIYVIIHDIYLIGIYTHQLTDNDIMILHRKLYCDDSYTALFNNLIQNNYFIPSHYTLNSDVIGNGRIYIIPLSV